MQTELLCHDFLCSMARMKNEIILLKIFLECPGDLQVTLGRIFLLVHVGYVQAKLQPRSVLLQFLFKHIFSLFYLGKRQEGFLRGKQLGK
jgi:hypothetical protein